MYVGSRAYGRDAALFTGRSPVLKHHIVEVLRRETVDLDESRLAVAMGRGCVYEIERRFEALRRFLIGLEERT